MFAQIINSLSDLLYTYVLIVLLLGTGIYFTVKTRFVQFRFLREAIRVVMEPKDNEEGFIILPGTDGFYRVQSRDGEYCRYFYGYLYRGAGAFSGCG